MTERRARDTQRAVLLIERMTSRELDVRELYGAHVRVVWRALLRLGVPPIHIEDAVHDVFLTAHHRRATFEGRSTPLTWLLGIAAGVAANRRRTARKNLEVPSEALEVATAQGNGPEAVAIARAQLQVLQHLLSQLPDEQREVVVLIDLEQQSAPEVALALGHKLNTVYSRLRLGRATLAQLARALQTAEEQS